MNDSDQGSGSDRGGLPHIAGDAEPRALTRHSPVDQFPRDLRFADAAGEEVGIDLLGYWRILWSQRWVILAVTSAVVLFALAATLLTAPTYRASTSLQIDREALKVVDFEGDQRPVEGGSGDDFYQTQYELLKSRALAQRVSDKLGLPQDPKFTKLFAPSPSDRLLGRDAAPEAPDTEQELQAAQETSVQAIRAGLTVEPIRNSRLVRLHFDSPDPEFSAEVANAFADAFISSTLERRFDASSYAKAFLEERLEQLKARLEDSERELVQFAQKEQIVNGEEGGSLSGRNLTELNSTLAQAQAQRIRAEARWRQASSTSGAGLPADMLAGSIIRQLQERRAELLAEYQENLRIYKPDYPLMQQIQGQIDELDRQVDQELVGIRASVKAEYDAAVGQERLLGGTLGAVRGQVLDLQNRSIDYTILKREVDTNRQIYDALLQRYKEIGVAGGVSTNNVSIVDRAQVPGNRFKPSLTQNLALALLAGLIAGVTVAFLREHLDDTIRGPEDMEKLLGLPVLGSIPLLTRDQSPMQASADMRSAFAESYRSVRTALQFSTDTGVPRVLLITSATPGEGKSTTALLLARNLAQLGKRVLLIDADLRNPSLHRTLQLENSTGLSNYLAGATPPVDAAQDGGVANLWIIPSGPLPPNPAELLAGPKMKALLEIAVQQYDQVIIDGPPIMGLADAAVLSHLANGTLLMVAAGKTRRGLLKAAYKRLIAARARVLGSVVTMYDAKRAGYGDYAYYNYGAERAKQLPR
ncbi:MAG: polysaccharide biosynthesis tyrosine autokinase [Lysobacter sp.]|nr:polysaccharide biosynthesis tyrosine autokinase [Lysobacter sp.]